LAAAEQESAMPSPFPGMDPYLEGPDWRSFHSHFANEIARYLSPRLRPNYIARAEKVYVLSTVDDVGPLGTPHRRTPDLSVIEDVRATAPFAGIGGGPAVLDVPLHVDVAFTEQEEPQITVEIRDPSDRSLVTAIEVLSTTNKRGESRIDYLAKRNRVLKSDAHLIEIDLLRTGRRMPMAAPLPDAPYFVVLSRADRRPECDVWPIGLRTPLPTVPVPLRGGDADVPLDLQEVLTIVYDLFSFDADVDYTRPPPMPLAGDDAAWATELLAGRPH
jgi:hypothetical protein